MYGHLFSIAPQRVAYVKGSMGSLSFRLSAISGALFFSACVAEHPVGIGGDAGGDDATTQTDGGNGNTDGGGISGTGPYCEVARVFAASCNSCHFPGGNYPDLTFSGAMSGLVGGTSHMFMNRILVQPNDPSGSLLYRKVAYTQAGDEGTGMPAAGQLPAADVAKVEAWINAGAPTTCDVAVDGGVGGRHHPVGFNDSATHGIALKEQAEDCRSCHGNNLEGATGPSCDSCHQAGWRTNCTYCHGGTDTMTGAPPRDLHGATARDQLTFRAHTEHTTVKNHAAYDCTECHVKPADVLSVNHIFDNTPGGMSEVDFQAGLSPNGSYGGSGSCASLYCHGNGRTVGSYSHDQPEPNCSGCHTGPGSTLAAYLRMSGEHARHMREGYTCVDCHGAVVDGAGTITTPDLHVNGAKDIQFNVAGFTWNNGRCAGTCHGERHNNRGW